MSLLSYITPENCSREQLEEAVRGIDLPDTLGVAISPKRKWFGMAKNRAVYVELWLHDLLTDEADWNANTWDMEPEGLSSFADFLMAFSERIGRDYSFSAIWAGDSIENEVDLSVDEIVEIVKSGNIGTKTRYNVKVCGKN